MSYPESTSDARAARDYFRAKMEFTTGPVELERELGSGKIVVVDVRAAEDFQAGHIPGAVNLPEDRWDKPHGLNRDRLNVLCCYSQVCHLAAKAALRFAEAGYPVQELEGGFAAWKDHDLPVEQEKDGEGENNGEPSPAPRTSAERSPAQENL